MRGALRWVALIAGLVLGALVGLWYGWEISPVQYANTSPGVLRADYRHDYVLMVAEAYSADHDLTRAATLLSRLGQPDLPGLVRETAASLASAGYSAEDLIRLRDLADDLGRLSALPFPTP